MLTDGAVETGERLVHLVEAGTHVGKGDRRYIGRGRPFVQSCEARTRVIAPAWVPGASCMRWEPTIPTLQPRSFSYLPEQRRPVQEDGDLAAGIGRVHDEAVLGGREVEAVDGEEVERAGVDAVG